MEIPRGLELTKDVFFADNQSEVAQRNMEEWHQARESGDLIAILPCADARHVLPHKESLHMRSIACGCPKHDYADGLNDRRVKGAMPLGHYNGEMVEAELLGDIQTCGGRRAKALHLEGKVINFSGVHRYVNDNIDDSHLVRQTLHASLETGKLTDKLVLAAYQDHTKGTITPYAVIHKNEIIEQAAGLDQYLEKRSEKGDPNPKLPSLKDSQVPPEFEQVLAESRLQVADLENKYGDLSPFLSAQRPEVIWLSTNIKPPATRFPNLAGIPGYYFQLSAPRMDLDYRTLPSCEELQTLADQAEYPIIHANEHHGQEELDFSTSRTLFIDTGMMPNAEYMAQYLVATKPWMRQFLKRPDTQVILAEVVSGKARKIERYL